ncbi:MAG: hypothetical protein IJR04_06670 [Bacteroidales bacterium]|nr:hypothetical protein [Bacteroidales bacterium]
MIDKTKVPPWFAPQGRGPQLAIQVGSVVETVGAKIQTFFILTKYFQTLFTGCYISTIYKYNKCIKAPSSKLLFVVFLHFLAFSLFADNSERISILGGRINPERSTRPKNYFNTY